jgi:outer membrane lipoprotein-sorting protein
MVLNGAFYYQRPGSIRWEYTTPYKSILLMNKGQLRRFTWSDNQWIQNTDPTAQVMQPVILEMRRWLSGRFTSSPTFKAALEPGQPRRIILIPGKAIRDFIQRVVLQLGRRPGTIRKVEIRQYQGASTSIEFRELRINSELPRELFERP